MKKIFLFLRNNLSFIFFLFSLILLIYTTYKSYFVYSNDRLNYYYPYYFISIFLLIISIISIFLSEKIKTYLYIFLSSIFLSFYFFEFYLVKHENYKKKLTVKHLTNSSNLSYKTGKEIYYDLKKKYPNKSISFHTNILKDLKNYNELNIYFFTSKSNSKTISCNENGYYMIYDSDRYGFNNPDTEWNFKEIDYVLIGDSFTFGACVNRPDDIASNIRNISKKKVINLGWGGNGPLSEYAILREYFPPKTKHIIWLYYENDLNDLKSELFNPFLKKYINDVNYSQNLKNRLDEIEKIQNYALEIITKTDLSEKGRYNLYSFIKLVKTRTTIIRSIKNNFLLPYAEFEQILKLTKELSIKKNSKLIFVYLPSLQTIKSKKRARTYYKVKTIVEKLNIPIIDIKEEVFDKVKKPLTLFPNEHLNFHYNPNGYKAVALEVYNQTK